MADTITTKIGEVSAYLDAVKAGFVGTREEFGRMLANGARYSQEALDAANRAESANSGAVRAKTDAESARADAIIARAKAEDALSATVIASNKAETFKVGAETAKDGAVGARLGAETAQAGAVTAKSEAEAAQNKAEIAQAKAESAQQLAENKALQLKAEAETVGEVRAEFDSLKSNIVQVSDTKPTEADNRIWLSHEDEEYEVPSYEEFTEIKNDVAQLSDDLDGLNSRVASLDGEFYPVLEIGALSASSGAYQTNPYRVRTPKDKWMQLPVGSVISLGSYSNARFVLRYQKTDGTYSYTGVWQTTDYTVKSEGLYAICIAHSADTKVLDSVEELGDLLRISMPSKFTDLESIVKGIDGTNVQFAYGIKSIAHQGYRLSAPSNTIPAFMLAIANRVNGIETDVRWTSDDVPVLHHEANINDMARNADGSELGTTINIATHTYAEISQYDYGISTNQQYAGTKICTFYEYIDLCKKYNLIAYIEIKDFASPAKLKSLCDYVNLRKVKAIWSTGLNQVFKDLKTVVSNGTLAYQQSENYSASDYTETDGAVNFVHTALEKNDVIVRVSISNSITTDYIDQLKSLGFLITIGTVDGSNVTKAREIVQCTDFLLHDGIRMSSII